MKNEKEFLTIIGACFLFMLICSFLLTCFGVIDLRIVNEIEFSPWTDYIFCIFMYILNMIFIFSISFRVFDKQILEIFIPYLIAYIILTLFIPKEYPFILSFIFPCLYIILFASIKFTSNLSNIIMNLGIITIILGIYQQISGYIKFYGIGLQFYECNIIIKFVYSIDLYLFYILIWWVVKNYALQPVEISFRFVQLFKSACTKILSNRQMEDVSDMTERQRRVFSFLTWGYLILQSTIIIGTNIFINKIFYNLGGFYIGVIELVIAWIALEIFRLVLGRTLHFNNPIKCTIVSFIAFYIISRFALPLHISLFFNICIVALMAEIIHIYIIKNEHYKDMETYLLKYYIIPPFNPDTATETNMRQRCRDLSIAKEYEDFCVMAFVWKMRRKEIADKTGYPIGTVKNYVTKYRKELSGY